MHVTEQSSGGRQRGQQRRSIGKDGPARRVTCTNGQTAYCAAGACEHALTRMRGFSTVVCTEEAWQRCVSRGESSKRLAPPRNTKDRKHLQSTQSAQPTHLTDKAPSRQRYVGWGHGVPRAWRVDAWSRRVVRLCSESGATYARMLGIAERFLVVFMKTGS